MDSTPCSYGAVDWKDPAEVFFASFHIALVNHADSVEWDGLALIASGEDSPMV